MPIVGTKRQITLPARMCKDIGFNPGDDARIFVANQSIVIIPRRPGSAWGCLEYVQTDDSMSDEQSRQDAIARKHDRIRLQY